MRVPLNDINTKNNSEDINKFGTYIIKSISTDRVYVGMTIKPFRVRWMRHLADLQSQVHHTPRLQEHFNTFGAKDLEFEIDKIWISRNSETINIAEQREKDLWLDHSESCFNAMTPRGGLTSRKLTLEEFRDTINELAVDPHISMKDVAKIIGVGYGTLHNFVKAEKIEWISNRDKGYIVSILAENRDAIEVMGKEYYSLSEAAAEIGIRSGALRDYVFSQNIPWLGWGKEISVRNCFRNIQTISDWAQNPAVSIFRASEILGVSYPTLRDFSHSQNIFWVKKNPNLVSPI